jgi:HAD superfamily hydrolase (TIGR01459 family)
MPLISILEKYDLFLLDLWGVVHDGSHLYPGVEKTVRWLHENDKKIIFISNAPRRSRRVKVVLKSFGIEDTMYDDAVSSGEVGYQWLKDGKAPWGKKYYYLGPAKDSDVLEGLDFVRVDDIKLADFLLNVGYGSEEQSDFDFGPLLRGAKGQELPMLCLNPDLEVVKITGERFPCAGILGKEYARLGGDVTWFGKPYPEIYDFCTEGWEIPKSKILAVGDSLETDIPGAKAFGIDSMLITGGILKKNSEPEVARMCKELGLEPNYVLPSFGL